MNGGPKKTYTLGEALMQFAKPEVRKRLEELAPHSHLSTPTTEHLNREWMQLADENAERLIELLSKGELLSRDYDEWASQSEPKSIIHRDRWVGLYIDPRMETIGGNDGQMFPTVEIWDPNEDKKLKSVPIEGLPRIIRFNIDQTGKRILFEFGIELTGTSFALFCALASKFEEDRDKDVDPGKYHPVQVGELADIMEIEVESVAPYVMRARQDLAAQFKAAGVTLPSEAVIQTMTRQGYRLNPNLAPTPSKVILSSRGDSLL